MNNNYINVELASKMNAAVEKLKNSSVKVMKRHGSLEDFNANKIRTAVFECFSDLKRKTQTEQFKSISREEVDNLAWEVTYDVINEICNNIEKEPSSKKPVLKIEEIQSYVYYSMKKIAEKFENDSEKKIFLSKAMESYVNYRLTKHLLRKSSISKVSGKNEYYEYCKVIEQDRKYFKQDYQYFQFISKFARWNAEKNRRETWTETCERVINFFKKHIGKNTLKENVWNQLHEYLITMKATPALRVIQMAGPALERCNIGVYNCSYLPISDLKSFSEILYILMQGTGVGFSVENKYIQNLPTIKSQTGNKPLHFVVPDTTEGWCDALYLGLNSWFNGEDVIFDYSQIRPAGARLFTKGGRASGPEPLKQLLLFTRKLILSKQGKKLSSLDCHDIACMIGRIVQVGGVRRASEISLSDLSDEQMRYAKFGDWYINNSQRAMANNSAVYECKPNSIDFMNEWLALAKSQSGERGIFNRQAAKLSCSRRNNSYDFGTNPCAEIILRPYGLCNLSIAIARPDDDIDSLAEKVKVATIFGIIQACFTKFSYVREDWKKNAEEERLLGVDITGQMDCPLLQPQNPNRENLLKYLKSVVEITAKEYSQILGINMPAALTCVKPSGDSSQLFDCSAGVHPRYANFYIRRFRCSVNDPVARLLISEGVPYHYESYDDSIVVFDFYVKTENNKSIIRNQLSAIEQLENWLVWKTNWAEHSVSCTIYVKENEWLEVGNWVYNHFDKITGLSFLPYDSGIYSLTPYEEITEKEYYQGIEKFPTINWAKLMRFEQDDHTTTAREYACTSDACSF